MTDSSIIHVVVTPPPALEEGLIAQVAAIIGKDLNDTRLFLAGNIPRIITHCHSTPEAEAMAGNLREMGIGSFICDDSDLRKPVEIFKAYTTKIEDGEVIFRDRGGKERRLKADNVFLLLKIRKQTYIDEEITKTKMKFSLPTTLLAGGIPVWRRVSEQTWEHSVQSEYFIRIYERNSPETSVEIQQNDVNYSFLGENMTFSSVTNFSALTAKLRQVFPQAIFDDRLTKYYEGSTPSVKDIDDLEVKLRLIYMYYLTQDGVNRW